MLAGRYKVWSREGGPFDLIAIAVSLMVIVGGYVAVTSRSMEFRPSPQPIAIALPVFAPTAVPAHQTPRQ